MTKLVYFAWVRERIGMPEEDIDLPESVKTDADLLAFLKTRGENYEAALAMDNAIRIAVDQEHVEHGEALGTPREIALFPPMTGAEMAVEPVIRVQSGDFDAAEESARLTAGRTDVGAVVTFTGLCRDERGQLAALELEHYPGMAEAEIGRIAQQAIERWPVTGVTVIHRFGKIAPGENIVLVVTASTHREAAFEAASFLMDFLKTRAPFWKKEHGADGTEGGWVAAKDTDDAAAERW